MRIIFGASLETVSITVTNKWQRFELPFVATGTSAVFRIGGESTWSTEEDIYAWGGQVEELPFASSYIHTTISLLTRTADNLSIDSANIPSPTADYSVSSVIDTLGSIASPTDHCLWSAEGEVTRILRTSDSGNSTPNYIHTTNTDGSPISINTVTEIVVTKNSSIGTIYQDGVSTGTLVPGAITGSITDIAIGNKGSSEHLYGHIKNFRIYNIALTADQVAALL